MNSRKRNYVFESWISHHCRWQLLTLITSFSSIAHYSRFLHKLPVTTISEMSSTLSDCCSRLPSDWTWNWATEWQHQGTLQGVTEQGHRRHKPEFFSVLVLILLFHFSPFSWYCSTIMMCLWVLEILVNDKTVPECYWHMEHRESYIWPSQTA